MPLISELFAFVVIDDGGTDDEGVPAFKTPRGQWFPLMGADPARVQSLMEKAQEIADTTGKPMKIYRFGGRELMGEVNPRTKP